MKILFVSYYFAPDNEIAAVRTTKLAKYLSKNDCDVTSITYRKISKIYNEELMNDIEGQKVYYIPYKHTFDRFENFLVENWNIIKKYKELTHKKTNTSTFVQQVPVQDHMGKAGEMHAILRYYGQYYLLYQFKEYIRKNKINLNDFDVVITSYGPLINHLAGIYIKNRNPDIKWIADFRDPMYPDNNLIPSINKKYKPIYEKVTQYSNYCVAVSKGAIELLKIYGKTEENKYHLITNGYDLDDATYVNIDTPKLGKFTLSYTGSIYIGKQDFSLLFRCISELINEKVILETDIIFNYCGNDYSALHEQASKFNIEDIIINHGLITRKESLDIQNNSHLLILTSWNTEKSQGIISGKFYEYILSKKPIVALIAGDKKNSELKEMIECGCLGICSEYANYEYDYIELKNYLNKQYNIYVKYGKVEYCVNNNYIKQFEYNHIAQKLLNLI